MAYELDEQKRIGLGLIGFGIFFTLLAIILFSIGVCWLWEMVFILLGLRSTLNLFRRNYRGSACFLLGLFFLFVRWPVVGIIFELYGCFALFSGFWPSVKVFLYHIPVVGWILRFLIG